MIGVTAKSDAEYYLRGCGGDKIAKEATRSVADYHLQAVEHGEPVGQWITRGDNPLGLSGEVDPDTFRTLVNDLRHPDTGEALGKRPYQYATAKERAESVDSRHADETPEERATRRVAAQRQSRTAVHAWDVTFSVPKSISVLHAALEREGRHEEAQAVWDAIVVGIDTALDVATRDLAYTRDQSRAPEVAGRTTTRYVHNPGWTMAAFRHHTSRDEDPQLHAHVCLLNRVRGDNGRWKTIYSPALLKNKHMLDAVFLRVTEGEITRRTGHTFAARPDGKAREVRGVDQGVRDFFSTRSRAVTAGAQAMIEQYVQTYGRAPSAFLKYQINQAVTLSTRRAKAENPPTRAEALARWADQLGDRIKGSFTRVLAQADQHRVAEDEQATGLVFNPVQVIEQAIADLDETKSTWTRANLYHAIANRLPDRTDALHPGELVRLLDELTDAAAAGRDVVPLVPPAVISPPDELRDHNGRFVFDAPGSDRFTTRANLAREDSLVARLDQLGGRAVPPAVAQAALDGRGLGDDQHAAAMDILTSDKRIHLVVGAAGVGKSRLMGALDAAGRELHGVGLTGLTTAENAAQVLRAEGVERAFNVAAFLNYHQRAGEGRVSDRERDRFAVPRGATVVFDEAGTISTKDYYEVMAVADRIGVGKIVMIGDPEQVDAVDNAGAFSLMVASGEPHRMETVRRFWNEWERDASGRLRTGDAQAVHEYDTRGRVHGGSAVEMRHAAVENYVADTLAGRDSVVVVSSTEEAATVGSMVRERLVAAGVVDEAGVSLRGGTLTAGAGDRIQTRQNDRDVDVLNRDVWQVSATHPDGSLTVTGAGGERTLPAWYVNRHVDLAYAGTIESVQGRSTDTGHLLADPTMGRSRAYPGMTRGREANHVYCSITDEQTPVGRFADIVATDDHSPSARAVIRDELDRSENLGHIGAVWQAVVTESRADAHRALIRDVLGDDADRVLQDRGSAGLFRLLLAAEADGRDARATLAAAVAQGPLTTARSAAQVLHSRISDRMADRPAGDDRRPDTYLGRTPGGDEATQVYARQVAEQMDRRTAELGAQAAAEQPAWAERLGPVTDDPAERDEWVRRAGHVAAYREQYGHTDEQDAIGVQPPKVEPIRGWVWSRAADALGVDPAQRDLDAQSDGALLNRVQRWERQQEWLPPNVDDRLRTAHLAADEARRLVEEADDRAAAEARVSRAAERVEVLEAIASSRKAAMEDTREERRQAETAQRELDRRHPPERDEAAAEPLAEPDPVDEDVRDREDLARAREAMVELQRRQAARQERQRSTDTTPVQRDEVAERGD